VSEARPPTVDEILLGDCLEILPRFCDGSFQLIYIDPPFNTGREQARRTLRTVADEGGDRVGFGGRRYATRLLARSSYDDAFGDYLAFLAPSTRAGCSRARARSTSTSTIARPTTASCCSTRYSGASAFSTS
jgi:DNA modification methylase